MSSQQHGDEGIYCQHPSFVHRLCLVAGGGRETTTPGPMLRCTARQIANRDAWSASAVLATSLRLYSSHDVGLRTPTFLIFGSNTDIGKTVITAALVRAAAADSFADPRGASGLGGSDSHGGSKTHYIKPLQCGGSDETFIRRHVPPGSLSSSATLFRWETPASPHAASRMEDSPVSDAQVLAALMGHIGALAPSDRSSIWIETAGGVLSPSSSSPQNRERYHATNRAGWGWVPQADLYRPLQERSAVILIGDGRLGGISATLSSLDALLTRGYAVAGVLMIRPEGQGANDAHTNREALQEYAHSVASSSTKSIDSPLFADPDAAILSLPALPPEPEPLMDWYTAPEVEGLTSYVSGHLFATWRKRNWKA